MNLEAIKMDEKLSSQIPLIATLYTIVDNLKVYRPYLPSSVLRGAENMKQAVGHLGMQHADVAVLFIDIEGFSSICR